MDDMRFVSWQFKGIDDLDPVSHQMGIQMGLRNMTRTFKDELGSDWKEKLHQCKEEIDWCKNNGIPHPAFAMISGGERHESFVNPNTEQEEMDYYEAMKNKQIKS